MSAPRRVKRDGWDTALGIVAGVLIWVGGVLASAVVLTPIMRALLRAVR